jgi:hypothetical protein
MTSEPLALGPFRVDVDADRAAAYRRETGCRDLGVDAFAPIAYPAVWLSSPEIYAAISLVCDSCDSVPVHEAQSFSYKSRLRQGETYELRVKMRRDDNPPRLILDASVKSLSGEDCARIETMLRLVPRSALTSGPA